MRVVHLNPSLLGCLGWAFKRVSTIAAIGFVVIAGMRLVSHQPLPVHWARNPMSLLLTFAGVWALLALIQYLPAYFFGVELTATHLRASAGWGKQAAVPWERLTKVEVQELRYGGPSLVVYAVGSDSGQYINLVGLDRAEAHAKLSATAGPDHVLTKFFAPG